MHSTGPRSSVIIPAFNMQDSIRRAVESVLRQEPRPLEVIVVDDGSEDATGSVARSAGQGVIVIQQQNAGEAAARNRGIEHAHGEFVAFLDADDYWLPGFLAATQAFLGDHPDCIAASVGLRFKHVEKPETVFPDPLLQKNLACAAPFVIPEFFSFWGKYNHIRSGSSLFRRSALQVAGGMVEQIKISPDLEYWAYLGIHGKWGFIPQVLWVCDSETMAARVGWLAKHRARRKLRPSVEQWEQRTAGRLKCEDWPGFRMMRGRVAAGFAMNYILGGEFAIARQIVRKYAADIPPTNGLLLNGRKLGRLGWLLICLAIRARDYQKAISLSLRFRATRCHQGAHGLTAGVERGAG